MTNLDSVLKSRDITLTTKIHIVKAMVFPVGMYGCESWTITKAECWRIWYFWTVVLEKTLESPLAVRTSNQSVLKKSVLNIHWKDWRWSWCFSILATWCEVLTHWKSPWCWEKLRSRGEGAGRMASLIQWRWDWANSGRWWWTEKPGVLQFMGSQRVGHDWATELNWTDWSWNDRTGCHDLSFLNVEF